VGVAQGVKDLPSKHKALSSNSIPKRNRANDYSAWHYDLVFSSGLRNILFGIFKKEVKPSKDVTAVIVSESNATDCIFYTTKM
jgi:hypothetical protein